MLSACSEQPGGETREPNRSSIETELLDQSCGEMGGDYCAQGSCPTGYDNLGQSWDCISCCLRGPSCGELGGNTCCHTYDCTLFFGATILGATYDCEYCSVR